MNKQVEGKQYRGKSHMGAVDKGEMAVETHSNIPPPAIVALMSESSSSSPLMASCRWRGVIRFTFKSLEQFPANSST